MGFVQKVRDFFWSPSDSTSVFRKSLTIIQEPDGFIHANRIPQTLGDLGQEGLTSNVVMAPVMWIMRTFTEAVARVERREERDETGEVMWRPVVDHPLEVLIDKPNAFYDGDALWKATCVSYVMNGNAYWRKVRNAIGEVIQLWYVPHWLMTPKYDRGGVAFITHYEYRNGIGEPIKLAPRDVVHYRFGLDPVNPRLGISPLQSLLTEVCTDDEAARFSETILENMGVPGLMVSPAIEAWKPKPQEVEKLRDYFATAFSRSRRGKPMVMQIPTKVDQFGFDPNKLMLGNLRDIAEERVCAVLGIPAAVVGFGSGLQSTKVGATMRELRRLAWIQCLTPMQTSMGKQATAQLLPDFHSQLRRFRLAFDLSDVAAFPEDDEIRTRRILAMMEKGALRVDRAQRMLGVEVDDTQKVYLRPTASVAVDETGEVIGAPVGQPVAEPVATPEPDADPSDVPADDDTKLLRIIEARAKLLLTNGNGNHS